MINSKMNRNERGLNSNKICLKSTRQEEQVRMSWSVPRYPQQKRGSDSANTKDSNDDISDSRRLSDSPLKDSHQKTSSTPLDCKDSSEIELNAELTETPASKLVCNAQVANRQSKQSSNRRRCFNCGSATHILANCRVPPASVRRSNYRGNNVNVDRQNQDRFVQPTVPNDLIPLPPQLRDSEQNVGYNNIKQNNLVLSSGAVVPFSKHDSVCSDSTPSIDFGSLLVDALRLQTERQAVTRPSRQLPSNWRWPRRCIHCDQ